MRIRRPIGFLLVPILLMSGRTVSATSESQALAYLRERNIVQVQGNLGAPLTRVEGLAAILRSQEKHAPQIVWFSENLPHTALFSDIDQTAWYAPYIEVGFLENIIQGHADGTFHPGDALRVGEAVAILERAFSSSVIAPSGLAQSDLITRGELFGLLYQLHKAEDGEREYVKGEEKVKSRTGTNASFPTSDSSGPLAVTPRPFRETDPFLMTIPEESEEPIDDTEKTDAQFALPTPPPPSLTETQDTVSEGADVLESSNGTVSLTFASEKPFAISIPSLGIEDIAILHPEDPFSQEGILAVLKEGLGHLFSYPGNGGKVMVYGHSSSYPWDVSDYARIFRRINQLETGDRVYVTYDGTLHVYEVSRKQIVPASDSAAFSDDGSEELILYTCWPPDSIRERYLVYALPVETVALR